jgi:tRNA-2-methylthio-N6-dimethylallyladenosine synthase
MRRSYRSERFLAILSRVRDQIPDAAITTDIIAGLPTETEADLAETLRVVEASRFSGAFTFQYSRAPPPPPPASRRARARSSRSGTSGSSPVGIWRSERAGANMLLPRTPP